MENFYKTTIVSSVLVAIVGVVLALFLEYKVGIPFYFVGIITILIEMIILIIINCKSYDKKKK